MTYTYNASANKIYITTATTTAVFVGNGRLVSITINKATTGTIKVIDGASGTTANVATIAASTPAQTLWYNCHIDAGLILINSASEDITCTYILDNH